LTVAIAEKYILVGSWLSDFGPLKKLATLIRHIFQLFSSLQIEIITKYRISMQKMSKYLYFSVGMGLSEKGGT